MMQLEIDYFAVLREQSGKSHETLRTEAGTPAEVYELLTQRYGFELTQKRLRVAVNDEFTDWSHNLQDGDRLVFIPPVAGG